MHPGAPSAAPRLLQFHGASKVAVVMPVHYIYGHIDATQLPRYTLVASLFHNFMPPLSSIQQTGRP